jgi:hypothetical protein
VVFCRIFLNRQTAVAHQKIIQAIEDIVLENTGNQLQWRHIHGAHQHDYDGKILHWAADQHAGQAKGLLVIGSQISIYIFFRTRASPSTHFSDVSQ